MNLNDELSPLTQNVLNEALFPDRKNLLQHSYKGNKIRYRKENLSVKFFRVNHKGDVIFRVHSGTMVLKNYWFVTIRFKDTDTAFKLFKGEYNNRQIMDLILTSRVQVHCNCPAYKYYFQHKATMNNTAIVKEMRPLRRNPNLGGNKSMICKHIHSVLMNLPFYTTSVLSQYYKLGILKRPDKTKR